MKTQDVLFSARNLVCSYNQIHPILYIPHLDIPAGEICVLFGKSGSGKSTLLETLGLMTDTLAYNKIPYEILSEVEKNPELLKSTTKLAFYSHDKSGEYEHEFINRPIASFTSLSKPGRKQIHSESIWAKPDNLFQLRLNHFAFIFQNTNLMPNFSAEENVAITEMYAINEIKCGGVRDNCPYVIEATRDKPQIKFNEGCDFSFEQCSLRHARHTLTSVGIEEEKFKMPVKMLSGGQRQRIAFARAINANFSVVFGDEPTGNLDEDNSKRLMKSFQEKIVNDEHSKTSAIIVSHSIDLSLDFADRIILIDIHKYKPSDLKISKGLEEKFRDTGSYQNYGKINDKKIYFSKTKGGRSRQWFKMREDGEMEMKDKETIRKELSEHLTM